jgi:hypothetical protein
LNKAKKTSDEASAWYNIDPGDLFEWRFAYVYNRGGRTLAPKNIEIWISANDDSPIGEWYPASRPCLLISKTSRSVSYVSNGKFANIDATICEFASTAGPVVPVPCW